MERDANTRVNWHQAGTDVRAVFPPPVGLGPVEPTDSLQVLPKSLYRLRAPHPKV